jgi:hypothetical protein
MRDLICRCRNSAFGDPGRSGMTKTVNVTKRYPRCIFSTCCVPWNEDGTLAEDLFRREIRIVFSELSEAIGKNDIERRIGGPVKHTGFKRLA